jgi:hypothetical protein
MLEVAPTSAMNHLFILCIAASHAFQLVMGVSLYSLSQVLQIADIFFLAMLYNHIHKPTSKALIHYLGK